MGAEGLKKAREFLVLGTNFFRGNIDQSVDLALAGGLVLAPSGPGMAVDLRTNPEYQRALRGADLNLPDSGAMVLAWNVMHALAPRRRLRRLSGLKFLRALLQRREFQMPGASFWVMPSVEDMTCNFTWLREHGFGHLSAENGYVAPLYSRDADGGVSDPDLRAMLEDRRPRFVILNVGGGTQEQLGWWLRQNLSYRPAVVCTGAAIAFLSGAQVDIPPWADQFYLGWMLRIFHAPRKFLCRYWQARGIFWLVWKYRDQMPPLKEAGQP